MSLPRRFSRRATRAHLAKALRLVILITILLSLCAPAAAMPQPSLIPTRAGVGLPAQGNPLARGPPGHPYNNATDIPLWDHSTLTPAEDRLRGEQWCNALPARCLQRLRRINSVPWRAGAPPPPARRRYPTAACSTRSPPTPCSTTRC